MQRSIPACASTGPPTGSATPTGRSCPRIGRELLAYARDLQRLENRSAPIVVVSPRSAADIELGDAIHVDVYPAARLFARAARIVSACGFNVMRQTLAHRDRHSYLPLPRRFDDQFARAARRRAVPVQSATPRE